MVPRQGNAVTEMQASLIASTWSLITLRNGDATTFPRSFVSSFDHEFHCREQLLNQTFRKTRGKNTHNILLLQ